MAVHPLTAAKRVCELRDWGVSNLELNKILYLAHMISLGRSEGTLPLVTEDFEAWDYGPVLPSVYRRAKVFGRDPVQNIFRSYNSDTGRRGNAILKEVVDSLKGKKPGELVAITHWDKGAWAKNYRPGEIGTGERSERTGFGYVV